MQMTQQKILTEESLVTQGPKVNEDIKAFLSSERFSLVASVRLVASAGILANSFGL